ncbi:MAG TPA: alpha/beta hydrolase [Thermoanaerobaculia bacterium]
MLKRSAHVLTLAAVLTFPALAAPPASKLTPCQVSGGGGEVNALCGTYQVWENRAAKAGLKIGLKIVVLPALSKRPKPDPVFFLAGGPGQAATDLVGSGVGNPLRRDRDLVYVDQRGTGDPDRLTCELGGHEDDLQSYLGEMFPLDAVRACREELEKTYDLKLYTTDLAMDDFDEVRTWLGYGRINLFGGSYGTRASQVFLRRHPQAVRAMVLTGVVPMDEALPISHAAGGQRALDLLLGWCAADASCNARFPDTARELETVLDRLAQSPVTVGVRHPVTGQPVQVRLSRNLVADGLRWLLYNAADSARLPLLVHEAATGDFTALGQASVSARVGIVRALANGMFFSVTCAEDIPFIDPSQIPERTAGSFLGDYRVRQQMAACEVWPRATIEPGHREAVRSGVPVLLISGERDPVTPPAFATRAARRFTHAVQVVVPFAGHGGDEPCVQEISRKFIKQGSGAGLDTSCLKEIHLTPFVL